MAEAFLELLKLINSSKKEHRDGQSYFKLLFLICPCKTFCSDSCCKMGCTRRGSVECNEECWLLLILIRFVFNRYIFFSVFHAALETDTFHWRIGLYYPPWTILSLWVDKVESSAIAFPMVCAACSMLGRDLNTANTVLFSLTGNNELHLGTPTRMCNFIYSSLLQLHEIY